MSVIKEDIKSLVEDAQAYTEAKIEQFQLDAMEKSIRVSSKVITWLVISVLGILALMSFSIVCGLLLSDLIGSYIAGFGILGAFYLLLFILFYVLRDKWLDHPIKNALFGVMLSIYTKRDE
ncbi:phage holin family protein [Crocinitomix catalasitica]|uniref:phage holin family protein n=1 Tax=Crocinitomix catalasitica TaxID=184607 RepID=UPI00048853BA|nr:phage holin family protein [Crocinitomix catalasitica]